MYKNKTLNYEIAELAEPVTPSNVTKEPEAPEAPTVADAVAEDKPDITS